MCFFLNWCKVKWLCLQVYEDTPVGTTVYTLIGKVKPCPTLSTLTTPSRLQDEQIELEMDPHWYFPGPGRFSSTLHHQWRLFQCEPRFWRNHTHQGMFWHFALILLKKNSQIHNSQRLTNVKLHLNHHHNIHNIHDIHNIQNIHLCISRRLIERRKTELMLW